VIFDVEGVAYDTAKDCFYAVDGFETAISLKSVSVVSPMLYLPALQIVRLYRLIGSLDFSPTASCRESVFALHRPELLPYYRTALKHKGVESDLVAMLRYIDTCRDAEND